MKKLLSIAAVTVALVSLSSCKKDYTCTCKYTPTGFTEQTSTTTLADYKKKDAETACVNIQSTYNLVGGTCELK